MDSADLGLLLSVYGLQATGAIRAKFTWDAENRLVGWEPLLFVSGEKKVEFKYDYFGRRIEKKVYTYNGSSWSLSETRRFIWNNWLLLLELDGDGNVLRKLTWGRDLSGSLDGAGGIGGLLAIQDTNGTTTGQDPESDDLRYIYFYDANGNVGQVIDLAASSAGTSIKAHYEYDAYGKVLVQSGFYASANTYRFSTKPWDDETALGYWGERYYDARLGRWINHDPIGELGGVHLYAFLLNAPLLNIDPIGLACADSYCSGPAVEPTGPDPCPGGQDPKPQQPGPIPPGPADKTCDKVYGEGSCERFCKDGTPPCPKSPEKYPDAWGIACCPEPAKPGQPAKPGCTCVCTEKASGPYPDAGQQVVDCVRAHEDQHLANCGHLPAGKNNECNAYMVTAQCVGGKAGSCGSGPKACKCLKQLFEFLKNQVNSGCEANCKGLGGKKYDCTGAMKEAWRQLYAASVKNKCTGNDAVPAPPQK